MKYYLAYGSNLNVEQMQHRCPGAYIVGTAIIKNYRLMFKGSKTGAYLTIEPSPGKTVPVAIWAVTRANEAALDRYEGFPTFYYKKPFKVAYNGKQLDAFAYIMHEDRVLGRPSDYYVRTCLEGYAEFDFDEKVLYDAVRYSVGGAA